MSMQSFIRIIKATAFFPALLLATDAKAHSPLDASADGFYPALLSTLLLALFWIIYINGSRHARPSWKHAVCFHSGMVLCYLSVLGPLDEWAETSTTAHMIQHMMLMVAVTPLWVLSSPLAQIIKGGGKYLSVIWRPMFVWVRYPMLMAYIHGATIWFWHLPWFYKLALDHVWWHVFEHACFVITAGLFWWSVLKSTQQKAPWALLACLLTLMHTGFLGALLTFAKEPLYGDTRSLIDQQLAGLIMWVAGAVPYLVAATWAGMRWHKQLQRQMHGIEPDLASRSSSS